MDGTFSWHEGETCEHVVQHVAAFFEQLKRFESIIAIDWRDYTSFPGSKKFRHWSETNLELLKLLAPDDAILVRSSSEMTQAFRAHYKGLSNSEQSPRIVLTAC